jgi:hypothetical protein
MNQRDKEIRRLEMKRNSTKRSFSTKIEGDVRIYADMSINRETNEIEVFAADQE